MGSCVNSGDHVRRDRPSFPDCQWDKDDGHSTCISRRSNELDRDVFTDESPSKLITRTAPNLVIWLGFIKLEKKTPTKQALERLLYGSPTSSALGADVIALAMTDLLVKEDNVDSLRYMLKKVLRDRRDYIVNEDDDALSIKHIPCQLVKVGEEGERYMSLHVAVKRSLVKEYDGVGEVDVHDCFPVPVYITCKSNRKNEVGPAYKSIIAQDVVLSVGDQLVDLVLLGANLDTDDDAKLAQLRQVERLVKARSFTGRPICPLIWGDFNNRLVATESLKRHCKEKKGKWELQQNGVEELCRRISDKDLRLKLLTTDAMVFQGTDIQGKKFVTPECNEVFRKLFELHIDYVQRGSIDLPCPSYKITPLGNLMHQFFDFRIQVTDVTSATLLRITREWDGGNFLKAKAMDLQKAYFGGGENDGHLLRESKMDSTGTGESTSQDNVYLQLGWTDGVAVLKDHDNTCDAEICAWQTDDSIFASCHLPIRSIVNIEVGKTKKEKLKVWLGFLKLDCRMPTLEVMKQLLYGSPECSAEDADVIAVAFTDLLVTQDNVDNLRRILQRSLNNSDEYYVNEQDRSLSLKHIPCQLVQTCEFGDRYVSLSVAVHSRNVSDYDKNSTIDFCDCFPVPVYLTCKSPQKNEVAPGYKSVLAQDVVITRNDETIDLLLLSANLDFEDWAKLEQLHAMRRLIDSRQHMRRRYAAIVWGDFNNRLVAFEGLARHIEQNGTQKKIGGRGKDYLLGMLATPERRKELMSYDALAYQGKDVEGNTFVTSESNRLFRKLFRTHLDMVLLEEGIQAPLPSYKRTHLDDLLSQEVGCKLYLPDAALTSQLVSHKTLTSLAWDLERDCRNVEHDYFGWKENGKTPQRLIKAEKCENGQENVYLQLGWLDGVGIFKKNTVNAKLRAWEIEEQLQAFDHLPLRALVHASI